MPYLPYHDRAAVAQAVQDRVTPHVACYVPVDRDGINLTIGWAGQAIDMPIDEYIDRYPDSLEISLTEVVQDALRRMAERLISALDT